MGQYLKSSINGEEISRNRYRESIIGYFAIYYWILGHLSYNGELAVCLQVEDVS